MSSGHDHQHPPGEACLARSVADTLAEEPSLEAVTIDAASQKVSMATLGRTDAEKISQLTRRLTDKIQSAQSAESGKTCSLLSGAGECSQCESPLSPTERNRRAGRYRGGGRQSGR